jgi:hypothetical protein
VVPSALRRDGSCRRAATLLRGPACVCRHPDGRLALVPIWMTEERAAAMAVTDAPRFPVSCLRDLRLESTAALSSLDDSSCREGDDHGAKTASERGAGRPVPRKGPMPLPPVETRQRLLRLIGTLLREAASRAPTDKASATPIVAAPIWADRSSPIARLVGGSNDATACPSTVIEG